MVALVVEDTPRLNIWQVLHAGGLAEGAQVSLPIDPRPGLGATGGSLCLVREGGILRAEGGPYPQRLAVVWQEWLPGRCRPLFACPLCDAPRWDLFILGSQIACRHCLGLKYRRPFGDRLYRARRRLGVATRHRKAIAAEVRLLEMQLIRGDHGKRTDRG
jgi:hypothetical protein